MGCPKYMLSLPDVQARKVSPLLVILLERHFIFQTTRYGRCSSITIAVRDARQQREVESFLAAQRLPTGVEVGYITDAFENAGPAAALLSAHASNVHATWLVTGCDYPLVTLEALERLVHAAAHPKNAVTCFTNESGYREPLLALWKPTALIILKAHMEAARLEGRNIGPNSVIKHLSSREPDVVTEVTAIDATWLTNMNTVDDWMRVCRVLSEVTGS